MTDVGIGSQRLATDAMCRERGLPPAQDKNRRGRPLSCVSSVPRRPPPRVYLEHADRLATTPAPRSIALVITDASFQPALLSTRNRRRTAVRPGAPLIQRSRACHQFPSCSAEVAVT